MLELEELRRYYTGQNKCCRETKGFIYDRSKHRIVKDVCKMWSCGLCRNYKIMELVAKVKYCIEQYDMTYHFVMTCQGKEFEDKINYEDSYKFMAVQWNKLRKRIKNNYYKNDEFYYIAMPRAQRRGYCHYHVLLNKWIDINDLISWSAEYGLGYVSITNSGNSDKYIKHFKKKHEYIIPVNKRHFSSSRNIKKQLKGYSNFFHGLLPKEEIGVPRNSKAYRELMFKEFHDVVYGSSGYPLPFELLLDEFYNECE